MAARIYIMANQKKLSNSLKRKTGCKNTIQLVVVYILVTHLKT